MANIKHHGAVNGVTGSCHELFCDEHRSVLIDCGVFQGAEESNLERIPYLLAAGFNKPIYATQATVNYSHSLSKIP